MRTRYAYILCLMLLLGALAGCGGGGSDGPSPKDKQWLLAYQGLLDHWKSEFRASEANRHGGRLDDADRYLQRTFPFAASDVRQRLGTTAADVPDGPRLLRQIGSTASAGQRYAAVYHAGPDAGRRLLVLRRRFTRSLDASYRAAGLDSPLSPADLR